MKDLVEKVCILEIKIYRDRSQKWFDISQSLYIDKLL